MKMQALKTFSNGGGKLTLQGTLFSATQKHAEEYIRLGLAQEMNSEAPQEIEDITQDETERFYSEEELKEKSVSELKRIAKDNAVNGYSGMTKSELIFAIVAQQNLEKAEMEE